MPSDFAAYCSSMAREGEWGDHVTLKAVADYFGLRINLVTSFESEVSALRHREGRPED